MQRTADRACWQAVGAPLERGVRPHVLPKIESLEHLDLHLRHSGLVQAVRQGLPNCYVLARGATAQDCEVEFVRAYETGTGQSAETLSFAAGAASS